MYEELKKKIEESCDKNDISLKQLEEILKGFTSIDIGNVIKECCDNKDVCSVKCIFNYLEKLINNDIGDIGGR